MKTVHVLVYYDSISQKDLQDFRGGPILDVFQFLRQRKLGMLALKVHFVSLGVRHLSLQRKNEIRYDKINTKQERKGFHFMIARSFTKSITSTHLQFFSIYQFHFINFILSLSFYHFHFINFILSISFYQFHFINFILSVLSFNFIFA